MKIMYMNYFKKNKRPIWIEYNPTANQIVNNDTSSGQMIWAQDGKNNKI